MRLYHHPMSSNSRRALMGAVALGIDLELRVVELSRGEQRRPEFLSLNPNGRVPVLVDGDFVLTESHAIMQYLAEGTPRQTLYPLERRARADVNRWLFWSAHHFQPAISVLTWERVIKPMIGAGPLDPKEVARGEELTRACVRVLDAQLRHEEWVCQGRLTLADLALAAPLMYAKPAQLPLSDAPHLRAWLERVQSLEAWQHTNPEL